MTKKQIIRMVAFILASCCVMALLCDLFEQSNTTNANKRFTSFLNFEKDTVDAVWLGTSGVDRYWISAKAYEEYGMTVYPLASDAIPAWIYVPLIKEIYKRQNPELIIIDARVYGQGNSVAYKMEARSRKVMEALPLLSSSRVEMAFATMMSIHKAYPEEPSFNLSLLLPFVKYHTMWEEDYVIADHLGNVEHEYGGYFMHQSLSVKASRQKPAVYDYSCRDEIGAVYLEALYDLLDFAEKENIPLLFVDTPRYKDEEKMGRGNVVYEILEERGFRYINYCETDETGRHFVNVPALRRTKDFYNRGHVNYYGAEKFTAVFAQYLHENYNFADHRSEPAVKKDWDGVYDRIKAAIKEYEENKILREQQNAADQKDDADLLEDAED